MTTAPDPAELASAASALRAWSGYVASGYECPAAAMAMDRAAALLEQLASAMSAEEVRVPRDLFVRLVEYAESAAGSGYGSPSEQPWDDVDAAKDLITSPDTPAAPLPAS